MAESLKVLRRRVRSVRSIKQITRAMEMVSAAKLRRAQATLMAGRPYARKLQQLISHVAGSTAIAENPLFHEREGNRKILVLFTSDRGLCGGFNHNLIREAQTRLKAEPDTDWKLVCVGRRGHDYFRRRPWPIVEKVIGLGGQPDDPEARRLADFLLDGFRNNECDVVTLVYPAFISTAVNKTTVEQYLPLTPESLGIDEEREEGGGSKEIDYILEPSAELLLDSLLPRYLSSKTYITMAEAATSEHGARMIAMNNASKNCTELGDALTLQLNKARQATITTELLDIVGGAEALQG